MSLKQSCSIIDLNLIPYDQAYEIQKKSVQEVLQGAPQKIIFCEHPAVLTLGRLADERYILAAKELLTVNNVEIKPVDRGGDVTLHAPGQLVV